MNCSLDKNQTPVIPNNDVIGIAFFVVLNESNDLEKIKVEDITYADAMKQECKAFKFFPYGTKINHFGKELTIEKGCFN